jgi:hypothetical protein
MFNGEYKNMINQNNSDQFKVLKNAVVEVRSEIKSFVEKHVLPGDYNNSGIKNFEDKLTQFSDLVWYWETFGNNDTNPKLEELKAAYQKKINLDSGVTGAEITLPLHLNMIINLDSYKNPGASIEPLIGVLISDIGNFVAPQGVLGKLDTKVNSQKSSVGGILKALAKLLAVVGSFFLMGKSVAFGVGVMGMKNMDVDYDAFVYGANARDVAAECDFFHITILVALAASFACISMVGGAVYYGADALDVNSDARKRLEDISSKLQALSYSLKEQQEVAVKNTPKNKI